MTRGAPSLNPRGRKPLGTSLSAAMRARFPVDKIVDLAADLAEHAESEQVRLAALQMINDRAWGKVTERHEVTTGAPDQDEDLSHLTDAQLAQLEEIERRRDALIAGTDRLLPAGPSDE